MRHVTTVTIVAIVTLALAGCGGYVSKTPTAFAQLQSAHTFADLEAIAPKILAGQPVAGVVYLRETYPDIAAVTEVAERWFKAFRGVDYRTYDKTAWLVDLTADCRNFVTSRNDVEDTATDVANGKLIAKHNSFEPSVVVFGPDYKSAVVLGTESFTIVDATQAWLKANKFEKGKTYLNSAKLYMRKMGEIWQIDSFNVDAAVESK